MPRHQRAGTAHNQIDFHPGPAGGVERVDRLWFEQRIHFGDDARFLAFLRMLYLTRNGGKHAVMQGKRGLPHVMQLARLRNASQLAEHFIGIRTERIISRDQAKVGVETRSARVVVAGAQMHITAHLAALAPHHQTHFRVGLVPHHAINHVGTDGFQPARPVDIGFFIKTRHQFDHGGDFLAALGRRDQQLHQF